MIKGIGLTSMKKVDQASPFQAVKHKLYQKFMEKRGKGQRVSSSWFRIEAMKFFTLMQTYGKYLVNMQFKASYGWRCRFMKRRKIKFRKSKSDKNKSANEHIPEYEKYLANS